MTLIHELMETTQLFNWVFLSRTLRCFLIVALDATQHVVCLTPSVSDSFQRGAISLNSNWSAFITLPGRLSQRYSRLWEYGYRSCG